MCCGVGLLLGFTLWFDFLCGVICVCVQVMYAFVGGRLVWLVTSRGWD